MKWQYKYPQRAFPYARLIEENRRRNGGGPEFELLDTGIFDDDRYFDVVVEYGKTTPEELVARVTVHNRGPRDAPIHVIPHLWFRNTWGWGPRPAPNPRSAGSSASPPDAGGRRRRRGRCANLPFVYRLGARTPVAPSDGELRSPTTRPTRAQLRRRRAQRKPHVKDSSIATCVGSPRQPGARRDQGRGAPPRDRARGGSIRYRSAHRPRRRGAAWTPGRRRRRPGRRLAEPTPLCLRPVRRRRRPRASSGPGLRGPVVVEADLPVRREPLAHGDNPAWPAGSPRAASATTWRTSTPCACSSMPDKWEYPWFAAWNGLSLRALALVDPSSRGAVVAAAVRAFRIPPASCPLRGAFSD